MLSLVGAFDSRWPRALNVDHHFLVDADHTGLVQQIEVLIPARKWIVGKLPALPSDATEADLFLRADDESAYDEVPVKVLTDTALANVMVVIGEWSPGPDRTVWISPAGAALTRNGELIGLYVSLGHRPRTPSRPA